MEENVNLENFEKFQARRWLQNFMWWKFKAPRAVTVFKYMQGSGTSFLQEVKFIGRGQRFAFVMHCKLFSTNIFFQTGISCMIHNYERVAKSLVYKVSPCLL